MRFLFSRRYFRRNSWKKRLRWNGKKIYSFEKRGTRQNSLCRWSWTCTADGILGAWQKYSRLSQGVFKWIKRCSESCLPFRNVWFYAYVGSLCNESYRILHRIWIWERWYMLFKFASGWIYERSVYYFEKRYYRRKKWHGL